MFERFTTAARAAVVDAQQYAREFGHPEIGAGHVLLGVLGDEQAPASRVLVDLGLNRTALVAQVQADGSLDAAALASLGIDLAAVRQRAEEAFGPGALDRGRRQRRGLFGRRGAGGHIPFDREAKSALEGSLRAALAHHHHYIGTEHLLLGLLATKPGTALDLLRRAGLQAEPATVETRLIDELGRVA